MKPSLLARRLALSLSALTLAGMGAPSVQAQVITETYTYTPNAAIPDNSPVGVADAHTFASQIGTITNVRLTLSVSGGFNGDFYAYLVHTTSAGTGFAVLLNRTGRTAASPFGYSDAGFNSVLFQDTAANGDIHNYQATSNPGGAALTGIWAPDGRNVNPTLSLDTTPRSAFLTSFNGLNPSDGAWTLFISDASSVGQGNLASWTLEITGNMIPEPATTALLLAGAATGCALLRRRRASGKVD